MRWAVATTLLFSAAFAAASCGVGTLVFDLGAGGAGGSTTSTTVTSTTSSGLGPCSVPSDCGVSTECVSHQCQLNTCVTSLTPAGQPCTGGSGLCDENGACVGKDGDPCLVASDCSSGNCLSNVCCENECMGSCVTCLFPGFEGKCTGYPEGTTGAPFCGNSATCDGQGSCHSSFGSLVGASCKDVGQCVNNTCVAGYCRIKVGEICIGDAECETGLCKDHICTACVQASDCAEGTCSAGRCRFGGGAPCAANGDCAFGICSGGLCGKLPGAGCVVNADCATRYCVAGMCAQCSVNAQCPSGKCQNGSCLLPFGSYCTAASACMSGLCLPDPFFPKCQ